MSSFVNCAKLFVYLFSESVLSTVSHGHILSIAFLQVPVKLYVPPTLEETDTHTKLQAERLEL